MVKLFWLAIVLFFLVAMFIVTVPSIKFGQGIPLVVTSELGFSMLDVQFPTLTLCTKQLTDRWNLPRMLLNQARFKCTNPICNETDTLSPLIDMLLTDLLESEWLSREYFESDQYDREDLHQWVELLTKQGAGDSTIRNLVYYLRGNDTDHFGAQHYPELRIENWFVTAFGWACELLQYFKDGLILTCPLFSWSTRAFTE